MKLVRVWVFKIPIFVIINMSSPPSKKTGSKDGLLLRNCGIPSRGIALAISPSPFLVILR